MKRPEEMTAAELGRLFPVMLRQHDPAWAERFSGEKELLERAIGETDVARIRHIGSTAVPGLAAKPTIDILLELNENADLKRLERSMEAAGYTCVPQPQNPPPHLTCYKGYTPEGLQGQAYHVHIRHVGDWDEPYFCAYLRRNPRVAEEYGKLKQKLQIQFEFDRDAYTDAKGAFIREMTKRARACIEDGKDVERAD